MDLTGQGKSEAPRANWAGNQPNYVMVKFLDGEELDGTVNAFSPQRPTFFLRTNDLAPEATAREISFVAVKTVSFMRNRQGTKGPVGFSRSARLVTVRFLDRETLRGIAENYQGNRQGFFLAPISSEDVDRIYIPITAVRDVTSVKRLGEILTEEGMATPEMVERAIARQEQLRRQPLGEILVKQQAIDPKQLEEGLRLQREKAGKKLGEILVERRMVDPTRLEAALAVQHRQRTMRLGEICAEMGCPDDQVVRALAIQYNVPFVELSHQTVDPSLRRVVPEEVARRHRVMPLDLQNNVLTIAVADPVDNPAKEELRAKTGLTVVESVATPDAIGRAIEQFYSL
ncbi:MAG: hypothetical protein HY204_00955 [Nitrospirae bacterium]|nr:hypothetical protein [Nitrospirota bacterium]